MRRTPLFGVGFYTLLENFKLKTRAMNYSKVIGIDPGLSGGIAVYSKQGMEIYKMPSKKDSRGKNQTDVMALAKIFKDNKCDDKTIIFIEKVQAWVSDQDENRGKVIQIQKMLANYESLKTTIQLLGIDMVEVPSRTWQNQLGLVRKGMSKKDRKNVYKEAAQGYYPKVKVVLWNSDALCLVRFGMKKIVTNWNWIEQRIIK